MESWCGVSTEGNSVQRRKFQQNWGKLQQTDGIDSVGLTLNLIDHLTME